MPDIFHLLIMSEIHPTDHKSITARNFPDDLEGFREADNESCLKFILLITRVSQLVIFKMTQKVFLKLIMVFVKLIADG